MNTEVMFNDITRKTLAILVPYRNKLNALKGLLKHIYIHNDIQWILINLGDKNKEIDNLIGDKMLHHYVDYDDIFSIGLALNEGAKKAKELGYQYIMKHDVDCMGNSSGIPVYSKLFNILPKNKNYSIVPMWYTNNIFTNIDYDNLFPLDSKYLHKFSNYGGTNFIINTQHYLDLGGTPKEFIGYGWEDYATIYKFEKSINPSFSLPNYNATNISSKIRDILVKPKLNNSYKNGIILLHQYHSIINNIYMNKIKENKKILYDFVNSYN